MTAQEILKKLETLGSDSYKATLIRHKVREPIHGVKISELKKFQKSIKKDYRLSLELFDSGVYDAQYLAGLIADETKMTKKDLARWVKKANSIPILGTAVAWVAAESSHAWELGLEWIESDDEAVAQTGWSTLGCLVALADDADLDVAKLTKLLERIGKSIHDEPNEVRRAMNSFVIALGSYVAALTKTAIATGKKIGPVEIDVGDTACKTPYSPDYIKKVQDRGTIGRKRKTVRC